ncbi:MAG: carbamoyltransferase N-terminal domain-containing protein, partial [Pseudomonadales bacterium]
MSKEFTILGLSAFYHDSAAAIVQGGRIVAASQEERFTRIKHDASFPSHAITACLKQGNLRLKDVDYITFYDKPLIKFERLIETYLAYAPGGFRSFLSAMPIWLKEKLFLKSVIRRELSRLSGMPEKALPPLLFNDHHNSHAASAFYPSPFDEAAVLCMDGVGEWATTSVWIGRGN